MNLMMVDVTEIKSTQLYDEVILIGRSKDDSVTAEQLGAWSGTINYEILARISSKIVRIIV